MTATEKYRAVTEGKLAKSEFLRQIRQEFPMYINQYNSFEDTVSILRKKGLLSEIIKEERAIVNPEDRLSFEAIERGLKYELELEGCDMPSKESYKKARAKAVSNLILDPLYYINKIAGVKAKKAKEEKPASKEVKDKENAMVKVKPPKKNLQEGKVVKSEEEIILEYVKKKIRTILSEEVESEQPDQPEYKVENLVEKLILVAYICAEYKSAGVRKLLKFADSTDQSLSEEEMLKAVSNRYLGVSPGSLKITIDRFISGTYRQMSDTQKEFIRRHKPESLDSAMVRIAELYPNKEEFNKNLELAQSRQSAKNQTVVPPKKGPGRSTAIQTKIREINAAFKALPKDRLIYKVQQALPWAKEHEISKLLWKEKGFREGVDTLEEAATANLAQFSDEHASIQDIPSIINTLENIVTETESFINKFKSKVQGTFDKLGQVKNDEGIAIGAKYGERILASFKEDMRPVLDKFNFEFELPEMPQLDLDDEPELSAEPTEEPEDKKIVYAPAGLDESTKPRRKYTGR